MEQHGAATSYVQVLAAGGLERCRLVSRKSTRLVFIFSFTGPCYQPPGETVARYAAHGNQPLSDSIARCTQEALQRTRSAEVQLAMDPVKHRDGKLVEKGASGFVTNIANW